MEDARPASTHGRRTFLAGVVGLLAAACSGPGDDQPAATTSSGASSPTDSTTTSDDVATTDPPSDEGEGSAAGETTIEPLTPATFAALSICTMAPAQPAGPFPSPEQLDRRNVTEGYPGHPLRLGIRVVDRACEPMAGARVEIWHADASGDYSAYEDGGSGKDEGAGTTFLRGFQTADNDGIVEFQTIYPGWYEGRAVHIHASASVDGQQLLTTQLYFDEAYTETVYGAGEYTRFGLPDTGWANDRIIGDPATDGSGIVLAAAPTSLGDGTLGLVNLGVEA